MKDKKHIDKLFKDRFKNFEASPSPEVWGSIQASLESRKKNRKIIPLFWKVGGVAALLALLFTIGFSIYNSTKVDTTIVTNDESTEQQIENEKNTLIKDSSINNTEVASEENQLNNDSETIENSSGGIVSDNTKNEEVIYNTPNHYKTKVAENTNASEKNYES